jgi:hypothetical protein
MMDVIMDGIMDEITDMDENGFNLPEVMLLIFYNYFFFCYFISFLSLMFLLFHVIYREGPRG